MRRLGVWLGLLLFAPLIAGELPFPNWGSSHFSRLNAFHLGDILTIIPELQTGSTDFYHSNSYLSIGSTAQFPSWQIMIDGQKYSPLLYSALAPNLLALSPVALDSVGLVEQSGWYRGEYIEQGLLILNTRRSYVPFQLSASIGLGNESGDPGPYRYTDLNSANVDKIGQDHFLQLERRHKSNYFRAGLNFRQHTFSDPVLLPRVRNCLDTWPGMYQKGGLVQWDQTRPNHQYGAVIMATRSDREIVYMEPIRQERAVDPDYIHAGFHSRNRNSRGHFWQLRLDYDGLNLRENDFASIPALRYRQRFFDTGFSYRLPSPHHELQFAYNLIRQELSSHSPDEPVRHSEHRFQMAYAPVWDKSWQPRLSIATVVDRFSPRFHASLKLLRSFSSRESISASLAFRQESRQASPSFQFWQPFMLAYFTESGFSVQNDTPDRSNQFMLAVDYRRRWQPDWEFSASFSAQQVHNASYYFHCQNYPPDDVFDLKTLLFKQAPSGQLATGQLHLKNRTSAHWHHTASIMGQKAFGDPVFRNFWGRAAGLQLGYQLIRNFADRFTVAGSIRYQSQRRWFLLDAEGNFSGSDSIQGFTLVDLYFRKKFWADHLAFSVGLQNLLNRSYRLHPDGASRASSMFIRIDLVQASR